MRWGMDDIVTFSAGDRYDGEFKDGREDGIGIFTWRDGTTFHGFWSHGKKHGIGVFRSHPPDTKRTAQHVERLNLQATAAGGLWPFEN